MRVDGFEHRMAAHCESGTIATVLTHAGWPITEAMVFGVGSGIFFGYFDTRASPFPLIALRTQPGALWKKVQSRLGARFQGRTFTDADAAMAALDADLARGLPTAVQVDFFYMDYVPRKFRAHFNAHYVLVVGKEHDTYLVSDAYAPELAPLPASSLRRARFARGQFAPQGLAYTLVHPPREPDLPRAIRQGIKQACRWMLYLPVPFLGTWGIRTFARRLPTWPQRARDQHHLSHEILNILVALEERGTGGGGFRFLYASFLQQASEILSNPALAELSQEMMANGDQWREISLFVARMGREHDVGSERIAELSELVRQRAVVERDLFKRLSRAL